MIRFIQRIVIIFFAVSVVLFGLSMWKNADVRDTSGPEITMDSDSVTISINSTSEDILTGVKASDHKDGDVTDTLVVEGVSNFIEKGRREATIAAFDSDNNVTKVKRTVIYNDYESPRFSLTEPLRFSINGNESFTGTLTVMDCLDGDLTDNITIRIVGDSAVGQAGNYDFVFQVVNSAGDLAELPVTLEYYDPSEDNSCPKVVLSDYLVYISKGQKVQPWDYVTGIQIMGREYDLEELDEYESGGEENGFYTRDDIQISNPVDTNTPGTYEIVYSMDGEEGYQSHIRLIVIVEE